MVAFLHRALLPIALAAAGPAGADESSSDYVALRAGVYLPQAAPSVTGGSYGAGLDLELAMGRAFFPWMAGEIGVGYAQSESAVNQGYYPGQYLIPVTARFALVPLTASLKFILPAGSIEPYAFGGIGVYFATFQKDPADTLPTVTESSTILGFHAGAGATYRAGERILVGVDGRYTFVQDEYWGARYSFNGVGFTAAVAYRF